VRLFDGKYHDVDSDSRSFEIAGSKGFQAAFKLAKPCLLEPIMKIQVTCLTTAWATSSAISISVAVGSRDGVQWQDQVIRAHVPMSETLKYSSDCAR